MGGEIVNEFLMSSGYLPGAHVEDCPYYKIALKAKPVWAQKPRSKKTKKLIS
jgi:DNA-3-methyladenine glycosylase I